MGVRALSVINSCIVVLCLFLSVPAHSEVIGQGWRMGSAKPISPQEARDYYSRNNEFYSEIDSIINWSLANDLLHDPYLIYDYVKNHVEYVPYFGLLKGPSLTQYDNSGNDFDQASLMMNLLKKYSSLDAKYVYGTMTMKKADAAEWLGTSEDAVMRVLAAGGIPALEDPGTGNITMNHVWVRSGGCDFDPAFKEYDNMPKDNSKINVGSVINYSYSDFIKDGLYSGSAPTEDFPYIQSIKKGALGKQLDQYANKLIDGIRRDYANKDIKEVYGGRSIKQTSVTPSQCPQLSQKVISLKEEETWVQIPAAFLTTVRIQLQHVQGNSNVRLTDADITFPTAEMQTHDAVRIEYNKGTSGCSVKTDDPNELTKDSYCPVLYKNHEAFKGYVINDIKVLKARIYDLIVTVNHPYANNYTCYKLNEANQNEQPFLERIIYHEGDRYKRDDRCYGDDTSAYKIKSGIAATVGMNKNKVASPYITVSGLQKAPYLAAPNLALRWNRIWPY